MLNLRRYREIGPCCHSNITTTVVVVTQKTLLQPHLLNYRRIDVRKYSVSSRQKS